MRRALQWTSVVLGAMVLWTACTLGGINEYSTQAALNFTVQNFTDVGMVFQVVVDGNTAGALTYRIAGGGNQVVPIYGVCPTVVLFTGIRYDDQQSSPDLPFYAGTITSVSQGVFPGQAVTDPTTTTQAAAFPTFVCPASFQINAQPGQLTVALADRALIGGVPMTPTQAVQIVTVTPNILPR